MSLHSEQVRHHLRHMDRLFDRLLHWLAGQYDPASGGFFYARSSKASGRFTPDIESTSQALNMIERVGLLNTWPDMFKKRAIHFFQSKQDPHSGYFYDANPAMRDDEVMVGRAIGYCVHALQKLGAAPLYPLPSDRHTSPDYMQSPKAYAKWLRSIPLTNSWRGCDRLCNSAPYIRQLDQESQRPYVDEAFNYFKDIQDPKTGLWGEGALYVRISGTFKLHTFYNQFGMPMPRTKQMYDTIFYCLRHERAVDMCYIRNPVHLLASMRAELPPEDQVELIQITARNMAALLREDGGFSRELEHSPTAPNVAQVKAGEYYPDMPTPVQLGLGRREGDMNASTQALLVRWLCYDLVEQERPSLEVPTDWFSDYLPKRR